MSGSFTVPPVQKRTDSLAVRTDTVFGLASPPTGRTEATLFTTALQRLGGVHLLAFVPKDFGWLRWSMDGEMDGEMDGVWR